MLTKDQAATVADQMVSQAKARSDQKQLARLEARAGAMPAGMAVEQFKALAQEAETQVYRRWPFLLWMMLWIGLIAATAFFNVQLMAGAIILGSVFARQLGRKLVERYVRENRSRASI